MIADQSVGAKVGTANSGFFQQVSNSGEGETRTLEMIDAPADFRIKSKELHSKSYRLVFR